MSGIDDVLFKLEEERFGKRHKLLIKIIALLLVAIMLLLIAYLAFSQLKGNHDCKSELCVQTSADIIRSLDNTVEPCDDFYAFTCNKIPRNKQVIDPEDLLHSLIEETEIHNGPPEFQAQKRFYRECRKLSEIDSDREKSLLKLFDDLGGWPILDSGVQKWDGWNYNWVKFAIQARKMGLKFEWFLEFSIQEEKSENNVSVNYLKIDIPRYLLNPTHELIKEQRRNLIKDVANYIRARSSASEDDIDEDVNFIVDFETHLTRIAMKHSKSDGSHDSTQKFRKIKDLDHSTNVIWTDFINDITEREMQISDSIVFNVDGYLADFVEFLQKAGQRYQVNFMMWKMIEDLWPFLSKSIRGRFKNYFLQIDDPRFYDRRKYCFNEAKTQFPLLAESVFIQRHVIPEKMRTVNEITENIRTQILKFLEKASWINENGRKRAAETIKKVKVCAGGPLEIFENFRFYQDIGDCGFQFNSSSIIDMIMERNLVNYRLRFSQIGQQSDRVRFNYYKHTINIANFSILNRETVVIPPILLQDEIFNPKLPNYITYGKIGKIIAQDVFPLIFTGNDTYSNWWSLDILERNTQCLLDQSQKQISGQIEIIPDDFNLGEFFAMYFARNAYAEWLRTHRESLELPGLQYTPQQLFWIMASKSSCLEVDQWGNGENGRFKINGALKNSYNFAKDYKCAVGSKMNPQKKCQLLINA